MANDFVATPVLDGSTSSQSFVIDALAVAGNVHYAWAAIKAISADLPANPAGYTTIASITSSGHVHIKCMAKILLGGDAAPTINGAGTYIETLSYCRKGQFVGASVTDIHEALVTSLNSSAAQINYGALTIATNACALDLWAVYGQSGAGTLGTPTTLASATNSVGPHVGSPGGNVKSTFWTYLQSSAANVAAGNIPISGGSTATNRSILIAIKPAVASGVTVTNVSVTALYNGLASVTVTGTGFGASQGAGFVKISPALIGDGGAITQTLTSWADTSISFTAVRSTLAVLTNLNLYVQNNGGQSNATGFVVQFHKRAQITLTLRDRGDGDDVAVNWASKTGILYKVVESTILGATVQSGSNATTDGSGVMTLPVFDVLSGGAHTEGNFLIPILEKDDATLVNVRFGIDKITVTYT